MEDSNRLRSLRDGVLILVVDDDDLFREILVARLRKIGYEVVEASNGLEAVDAYQKQKPDLLLLDLNMPVMDGFEVCARLHELEGNKCPPILVITSNEDRPTIQKVLSAGAFDYITKPFDYDILLNRVQHLTQMRVFQRELEERNEALELLNLVSRAVSGTLEADKILEKVIYLTGHALNVSRAFVYETEAGGKGSPQTFRVRAAYVPDRGNTAHLKGYLVQKDFPSLQGWLDTVNSYAVIHVDEAEMQPQERAYCEHYQIKSMLFVPLKMDGEVVGYLNYWETRHKRDITPQEAQIIMMVSSQVSMVLKNAKLHEELRSNIAQLEERNNELAAYGHTIAHDLKNPLHIVLGYSDLAAILIEEGELPKALDYLNRIQTSGQSMGRMIDQLLKFAKTRDEVVEVVTVDMGAVINNSIAHLENKISERGLKIVKGKTLLPVNGNVTWVEEVVTNLVGNAIKYIGADNNEPTITIDCVQDGEMVHYFVKDNGIGIAKADQERLFKMFSRVDNDEGMEGLGLGLSIVERIVRRLGGQVGVESQDGVGSTFWFKLPAASSPNESTPLTDTVADTSSLPDLASK